MTAEEKRRAVCEKYREILGRNLYSQARRAYCFRKYKDGKYYSDCSSSVSYSYREAGQGFGILNTVGMMRNLPAADIPIVNGQVSDTALLRQGDLLLFAGNDTSRRSAGYVGHVEMVYDISGNTVTLAGYGSGTPRLTEMRAYCRSRYRQKADTPLGHRGLIRVCRTIGDDVPSGYIVVTGRNVNIRSEADTNKKILCTAHRGDVLERVGADSENGWHHVRINGREGYISGRYSRVKEDE